MKHEDLLRAALNAAWIHLCETGDYTPWVDAFMALYGQAPTYIPQH